MSGKGKSIVFKTKAEKQKVRNAERRFKRLTSNPKRFEEEQAKMAKFQQEFLSELKEN